MQARDFPYGYRAFSLNILSQFPVTGFEPAKVSRADVLIREDEVPETLPGAVNKGVLFQSTDSEFLLTVDGVARYHAHDGREITVKRLGHALQGEVSAFLIGTTFGALLHQRRLLPLHASTVIYNNQCLLFAGMSGSGKSTLAASLINDGGELVADDISVVGFRGEKAFVRPAFPAIKIWEDSLNHLGLSAGDLEHVRGKLRKFYLPVERFSREQAVVDHVFILYTHNKPEIEVKTLQGVDKFRVLKKHTYLFRGIPKTGLEQNHFMMASRLAAQVPVTMLTRSNGKFDTVKLVRKVNELLAG
jgi:hypothetical protein